MQRSNLRFRFFHLDTPEFASMKVLGSKTIITRFEDLEDDDCEDVDFPSEVHVMEMARKWSIAPIDLSEPTSNGLGILGVDAEKLRQENAG